MSVTKLKTDKLKSDKTIGNRVNATISGFYAFIIILMSGIQLGANKRNSDKRAAIEVFFLKNWYAFPHPWQSQPKTDMTIFHLSTISLCIVLFLFCAMNLFILKETVLIYAAEVTLEPGGLSK